MNVVVPAGTIRRGCSCADGWRCPSAAHRARRNADQATQSISGICARRNFGSFAVFGILQLLFDTDANHPARMFDVIGPVR